MLSPSFCCKSAATSDLWSWANGPIRVDLGVTWPAKWRGMYPSWPPGGAGADIGMLEGLAHFYVMQNTDNLYFPRAIQWIKNTFHVILWIIQLFLLVQYDVKQFILIKHDNFKFILIFEWQHFWKSETCLVTDKLEKLLLKWWLVSLSKGCRLQRFIDTFHMPCGEKNASTITLWIIRSLGPR